MEKEEKIIGGRYVYRKTIGKGGNGSVFLCYDTKLQKEWAVKELCRNQDSSVGEEPWRETEIEALKTISCNVFPRIVDVVREQESIYLIMDYVEGITLKERMGRSRLKEKEVLGWGMEIAKALRYLHQMSPQMLYLDCKPENIMLTTEGEIRLVDLGSVYICNSGREQRLSGTCFFAPRELRERKGKQQMPDVRTDIYIFGMTLYCLLTGKRKEYRRNGRLWTRDANPHVSYGLNAIIAKCTEKEPENRYHSMDEVLHQLAHVDEVSKQEREKNTLEKIIRFFIKVCMGLGCLTFAKFYIAGHFPGYLLCSFVFFWVLLVLCKLKRGVVYEVNKEIFCGSGKRFLCLTFLCMGLFAGLHMTSYAAGPEEKFPVTIYDHRWRKILIKDGSSLEVNEDIFLNEDNFAAGDICLSEDIFLSFPGEEISQKGGEIEITYTDISSGRRKKFKFYCYRK